MEQRDPMEHRTTPLKSLTLYPTNPRRGRLDIITESLTTLGQYRTIVANDNPDADTHMTVLAGNHTMQAMRDLGWVEADVTFVSVDDETAARIVLMDNRSNDVASYDDTALVAMLVELEATDLSLVATGYDNDTLDTLLAELEAEQAVIQPGREGNLGAYPENPVATLGEVWQLGEHLLVCGDATDDAAYAHLPKQPTLVWTDPPYGVALQARNMDLVERTGSSRNIAPVSDDDLKPAEMYALWLAAFTAARNHVDTASSIYICGPAGPDGCNLSAAAVDAGWTIRHGLVWVKSSLVFGRADYHYRHEIVLYGWNQKHEWRGEGNAQSVFEVAKPRAHNLHPTSKPVDLIEPMLLNSSRSGEWVLDPFAGSGSTLIACDNLGRRGYMIEIDPGYCDVIVNRWESLDPANKAAKL